MAYVGMKWETKLQPAPGIVQELTMGGNQPDTKVNAIYACDHICMHKHLQLIDCQVALLESCLDSHYVLQAEVRLRGRGSSSAIRTSRGSLPLNWLEV